MTPRILVVDDVPANIKLLEVRLTAEYFEVRTATSGTEALSIATRERVDVVLLDVMMPDLSGFEVCRRLKVWSETAHIPIVMVTALDQPQDRVQGLESGADDFLTKPVSEIALLARVKSLVRLKAITDELNVRTAALAAMGTDPATIFQPAGEVTGRILVVDDAPGIRRTVATLAKSFSVSHLTDPEEALAFAGTGAFDLIILGLGMQGTDCLRLVAQMRALEEVRQTPVLILVNPDETPRLVRGLDMGVNDYVMRPVDSNELKARVRTQLKRKLYSDKLRGLVSNAMSMAVTDPLTGLHNRRYFDNHMSALIERSLRGGKDLSLLVFDIDHFKGINDSFGHDAGDMVLKGFAERLRAAVRGIDLVARFGGEEFVVVMPDTSERAAVEIAERIRQSIEAQPFEAGRSCIPATVSIGVSCLKPQDDSIEQLFKRADDALYRAKRSGRNRVMLHAA